MRAPLWHCGANVAIDLDVTLSAECAGCRRPREFPSDGDRAVALRGAECLAIRVAEPCQQCGATSVLVRVDVEGSK